MFSRYYLPLLIVVIAFAFCTRVWNLHTPATYVFDEVYHAVTAKLIARNDSRAFEWWNPPPEPDTAVDWLHPPLAKYTQAASIMVFGENAFGWRLSSAVFGTGVVLLTALLALRLFQSHTLSLLASFLASLDGLLLTQSRVAMNDIHVTFFILLTLLCYTAARPQLTRSKSKQSSTWAIAATGLVAGLAVATKWSGLYALLLVIALELSFGLKMWGASSRTNFSWKRFLKWIAVRTTFLAILPVTVYVLSYTQMFLQGKTLVCDQHHYQEGRCYYEHFEFPSSAETPLIRWDGYLSHFAELHRQIWHYQTHLDATHQYQSVPWQWFLNMRPVWYYVEYTSDTLRQNIYAVGNPVFFLLGIAAVGATSGTLMLQLYRTLKKTTRWWSRVTPLLFLTRNLQSRECSVFSPLIFLFSAYLAVWLPWMLSPRIMFFYHYTPAVPLLAILTAYWLRKLWKVRAAWWFSSRFQLGQTIVLSCVLATVLSFVIWYPHWTGTPVPLWVLKNIYWLIPSWQ